MGPGRVPPRLLDGGAAIEVELGGRPLRFHAMWLRDNAQDPQTRNAANGQRLVTLLDLPKATRIADARWRGEALVVSFEPETKDVAFDAAWLVANAYDKASPGHAGWTSPDLVRWDAELANTLTVLTYGEVKADRGHRLRWLRNLRRYGFARMSGAPVSTDLVSEIAALFGYVRETNYGRIFDVRADVNPSNLAYTNLGLQAHTDNPYRDPTPGLQILACLENSVEGGGSILVDGFKVAERLKAESQRGFDLLTRRCARFEYAGAPGVRLRSKRPILELAPDGELIAVRFNNRSAAPFTDIPYDEMADYYAAYRRFAELLERPDLQLRFRLEPGDLMVFDNLRILHAREAFSGSGERWLQGCYVDRDGLLSTLAAMEEADL